MTMLHSCQSSAFESGGESIEGERAQQVSAHAAFDFGQAVGGERDPGEVGGFCELL